MDVNFIITCYNRENYYPHLKTILSSFKTITPHIALAYNGERTDLPTDFNYNFRTIYKPNGGRGSDGHGSGCEYADADLELTVGGYEYLKNNGVKNWIKLSIDSWLLDELKIVQILNEMKAQNCSYAGNYWHSHRNLSTDIFFANTEINNIFEDLQFHGKQFFDYLYEIKNPSGLELFMGFIASQYDHLIIMDREPLSPDNTRWFADKLGWTMSHVLETNLEFLKNYKPNNNTVLFEKIAGKNKKFRLEDNKINI